MSEENNSSQWPNRGSGAKTANVVNRDNEFQTTSTSMPEKSRSPDWEKKEKKK